jgi:hypothetical protein
MSTAVDDMKTAVSAMIEKILSIGGSVSQKPASSIDYAGKYGVDTTAASSSVSAAVEAGKAAAGIVVDKTNPGKSAEELKAGRAVFDTEKGAAESAIAELENSLMLMQSSAGAELARNIRDMRSKGAGDGEIAAYRASQQAAEQASYAPLIKQILNYRGGLDKSGGLIESKNDEIAKAQKEQNSYLAALNKMTAQILNEIKALNDYNMTEIADSVYA